MIWGGDKTINKLRTFKTNERTIDINFADRYSFCVINQTKLAKLNKHEFNMLIRKFYNDTYLVDQNACSSPHLIVWTGRKNKNCQKLFWQELYNLVKEKYSLTELAPSEKYNELCKHLLSSNDISEVKTFENLIYIIKLKKLSTQNENLRGKWGLFFEYELDNLNKINKIINNKYQTLTYFGLDKRMIRNFIFNNNLKGIDRVVPIGQSLDIGLLWDGYNIPNILSRGVQIR